jgi:hypothetical protein
LVLMIMVHAHQIIEAQRSTVSGRLQCEGEQHTCSNRIPTAGNGEHPTIQFHARLLIGLQQHLGRRRHKHHSHHEEKASEDSDNSEDDHPYAVWSASTLGGRVLRRSIVHTQVGLLKLAHLRRPVCVPEPTAGPGQACAETHTPQDRDRPCGRDQLGYPEPNTWAGTPSAPAHCTSQAVSRS